MTTAHPGSSTQSSRAGSPDGPRLVDLPRRWLGVARTAVRQAGPERDAALLMAKAALATVVAWQFAVRVLHSPQPFYAPMAALLVVDRTLVRSLWASGQRLVGVVVGMLTAWVVGELVGVHWWSMLPVIYLALLIARWRRLGDHGIQVPTMVLLSLLTVGGTDVEFTYLTVVETLAGGVIGVLTNAVVLPPLHLRTPREQVTSLTTRVRALLEDMSAGLREGWDEDRARGWYDTSTELLSLAPQVHEEIETGRESTRLNPRDNLRRLDIDWQGYAAAVEAVRRSLWQVSGIARTLVDAVDEHEALPPPSPSFLDRYADALDHIGAAVQHFGLADDEEREAVRRELGGAVTVLEELGHRVREARLDDPRAWPGYGALLVDAQRLARELDRHTDVAIVPTDSGPIPRPGRRRRRPTR